MFPKRRIIKKRVVRRRPVRAPVRARTVRPKRRMVLRRRTVRRPANLLSMNSAYVKLNCDTTLFTLTFTNTTAGLSNYSYNIWPMCINPFAGATGTSPPLISTGDAIWTGWGEYANYFGAARLHGAKLVVKVTNEITGSNANAPSNRFLTYALNHTYSSAVPAQNDPALVNSLSYQALLSTKRVKAKVVSSASGGKSTGTLVNYARTKTLFNIGDLRDDPAGGNNVTNQEITSSQAIFFNQYDKDNYANPPNNWWMGVHVYGDASGIDPVFTLEMKLTGYWEFFGRRLIPQTNLIA